MNNDFPRILTLLRKERNLSQKQVAKDLGVQQALLSHYENGKRECGLDFLVRTADYFNVSTDYLLGRSPVSTGSRIVESDIPESEIYDKSINDMANLATALNKKLITNSVEIIFSVLIKARNAKLTQSVASFLTLAVYKAFRLTYQSNPKNDENIFSIPKESAPNITEAVMCISEGKANAALKNGVVSPDLPIITTATLESDYKKQATALLSLIRNSENQLKKYE